jgi:hypothetical protein
MKQLEMGTKAQADKTLTASLFKPVNGKTLSRMRYDMGKYGNNMKGKTVEVADNVMALWTEKRKDSDGAYWAVFCLTTE